MRDDGPVGAATTTEREDLQRLRPAGDGLTRCFQVGVGGILITLVALGGLALQERAAFVELESLVGASGLEIVLAREAGVAREWPRTRYTALSWHRRRHAVMGATRALQVMPAECLRRLGVDRIVLSDRLYDPGKPLSGTQVSKTGTVLVAAGGKGGTEWIARVMLHEAWHLYDIKYYVWQPEDNWTELNPPGFVYLRRGGKGPIDPSAFVSRYAAQELPEDRAETFAAYLLGSRLGSRQDRIISAKMALICDDLLRSGCSCRDGLIQEDTTTSVAVPSQDAIGEQ